MEPSDHSQPSRHQFSPTPRSMSESAFVERFGAIYEHAPWVARDTWQRCLTAREDTVEGLAEALSTTVETAGPERQLELIRAHPDLGGKAAIAGGLTAASAREQANAGLAACTPEQFTELQRLNTAYTSKFGFPFILAVTGLTRDAIIEAMRERADNDRAAELRHALDQIHRIARFRLVALAQQPAVAP